MTIVSLDLYQEIYRGLSDKASLESAMAKYPCVASWTIQSIYRMKWQEILKKRMHLYQGPTLVQQYYEQYMSSRKEDSWSSTDLSENALIRMAKELRLPSCLLCRLVLRQVYLNIDRDKGKEHVSLCMVEPGLPKQDVCCADPKDSESLELRIREFTKNCLNEPLRHLPQEPLLAQHIQACLLEDDICSPLAEKIKQEREGELFEKLSSFGVSFIVENGMRDLGFPKTPDALLSVPIAVDGCVVNWIESKAFFGDPFQHQKYLKKQYWSYHNRFGPGLVIYWCGFVQEVDALREQGILVREDFPDRIVQIKSELVAPM